MTLKSSFLYAIRFFTSKTRARKNLLASMFCVGLSIIPLIVVIVVSDSMIDGMTERIIELSSFHIQAIEYRADSDAKKEIAFLADTAEKIKNISGVKNAYAERSGMVLVAGKTARSGATVRAVEADLLTANPSFSRLFTVHEGTLELKTPKSAVIGQALSKKIGAGIGDSIRLISARTLSDGKIVPKVVTFTVEGICSCGYQELDALWIFVPLETGFDILATSVSRLFIGVETDDAFSPDLYRIQNQIAALTKKDFSVYNWEQLNDSTYTNFRTSKVLLVLIMFLIVLVASVNISSSLVMIVMERRRETAILKSVGANHAGIRNAFILTGFFTGLGGVLIGTPVGILCGLKVHEIILFMEKAVNFFMELAANLSFSKKELIPVKLLNPEYYMSYIPVKIPVAEIALIAAGTLVLSVIVSILPAVKAGREKPLEIMRKS